MSIPTACPSGATALGQASVRRATATPDVTDPLARARARPTSSRYGDTASVSRSRLGHDATHRSSFHRLVCRFVGHGDKVPVPGRFGGVRVGLVILPTDRWREARRQWEWADRAGFATAWTYDHIRWGGMPDGPWHAAVPVLAAAAAVTRRIRLGTLVATPNFRHPVTLAREAIALDDISGGRLDLGLGPGSEGFDASALGQEPWTPAERLARFEEFLQVLHADHRGGADRTHRHADGALHGGRGAQHAGRAAAPAAPHHRRRRGQGLRLAAVYGRNWVTIGPTGPATARRTPCSLRCGASSPCSRTPAGRRP